MSQTATKSPPKTDDVPKPVTDGVINFVADRQPRPMAQVVYWTMDKHSTPLPHLAWLFMLGLKGDWHLNILQPGYIDFSQNVPYSPTPKNGCWSWPGIEPEG